MKRAWIILIVFFSGQVFAQELAKGRELFELYCAACHNPGPGHPATYMLGIKRGKEKAVIKGREDLAPEYIANVVRGGLLEMAPFRPTEISDENLKALIAYIRSKD